MCRLLGIVAAAPYEYGLVLRDAPRSMAVLSREHSDGWGVATHLAEPGADWRVQRSTRCACNDDRFEGMVEGARGRVLIAHVRQKSVGTIALENTHPFRNGAWVFAHNGTIKDLEYLLASTSARRKEQQRGSTDSELFFSWLLTRFDEAGIDSSRASPEQVDRVLRSATSRATSRPDFGTVNFLLSNGSTLYAHRFGRELFLLDRSRSKSCDSGGVLGCPSSGAGLLQRKCIAIASEPITPDPWEPLAQGELLRIDLGEQPDWRRVAGADEST